MTNARRAHAVTPKEIQRLTLTLSISKLIDNYCLYPIDIPCLDTDHYWHLNTMQLGLSRHVISEVSAFTSLWQLYDASRHLYALNSTYTRTHTVHQHATNQGKSLGLLSLLQSRMNALCFRRSRHTRIQIHTHRITGITLMTKQYLWFHVLFFCKRKHSTTVCNSACGRVLVQVQTVQCRCVMQVN